MNLNQLAAAANTLLLLQDMPDVSHERRRELVEQIENFVATLKDPYCKALAETRGLMVAQEAIGGRALAWRCSRRSPGSSAAVGRLRTTICAQRPCHDVPLELDRSR